MQKFGLLFRRRLVIPVEEFEKTMMQKWQGMQECIIHGKYFEKMFVDDGNVTYTD